MEERFKARANFLDPSAQEFHPSSQFALPHPQFYYPYTPPPALPSRYVHPPQAAAADDASSRAVVLSMVPTHLPESVVTQAVMVFGGVRAVETRYLMSDGIATVHFYDLRSAQAAVAEIRQQHVRQQTRLQQLYGILPSENWAAQPPANGGRGLIDGHAVWAQFAAKALDVLNQGSLFVSVSDPAAISSDGVREIFQAFGPVMAVRESPSKPHHKFVEFFDVRDAARALSELNGREVGGGVRLLVEFTRPCGSGHPRSYQRHHQKKRPEQQNLLLPPRLARSSSQASSSSSSCRGGNQAGVVILKKNDARISNIPRNGNKNKGEGRSNSNSSSSCCPPPSSSKQQQQQGSCRQKNWKNHGKTSKKCEASASSSGGSGSGSSSSRFEIKEMSPSGELVSSSCRSGDSRTTVMIKNIPNKYSQKLLLNMLDNHCILCNEKIVEENREEPFSAYDFVYLPIDFNNKCNVGYGFVNLTSPEAAVRLHRAFHMQPWEVFNSRKICQVTYARLQGLTVLKDHFRNSKFACDNDEYMPVEFDPPRDGKLRLTEPLPITGGRAGCSSDMPRTADDDDGDSVSEVEGSRNRDGGSDGIGGSGSGEL